MKLLMRLWAFLLIASYCTTLALPMVALAATAPFPTCVLTITPSVVQAGSSATLTWRSTDATTGAITNVGNVAPNGSKQILPSTTSQITTYVGSFTGPGGTANCVASVQISYGAVGTSGGTSGDAVVNPNPIVNPVPITPITINPTNAEQPSLVQCGAANQPGGSTGCEACNLAQLIQNIINFAIGLSIPIAAALFAWAGILYFTSGANPAFKEKAKGIFSNALIGFLIAITAWIVVNTLLHALLDGGKVFTSGNWFTVDCSVRGTRPVDLSINNVINSVLPGVNTAPIIGPTSGSGSGAGLGNPTGYSSAGGGLLCDADSFYSEYFKECQNKETGKTTTPVGTTAAACGNADCTGLTIPSQSSTCAKDSNGNCLVTRDTANAIQSMCSELSGSSISCTSTGAVGGTHVASCQNAGNTNSGTCIDMVVSCDMASVDCLSKTVKAGQDKGLRVVFEYKDQATANALLTTGANQGLNSCNVIVPKSGITGTHASVYLASANPAPAGCN